MLDINDFEMEMCWILWSIRISSFHISPSLIFWTQTTYQQYSIFTDWEQIQSLASNLISPRIKINSRVEADEAACDFTASISSVYRLSTSKVTSSELKNDLTGLDQLLKYKKRLRNSWKETRDPECKTAVNRALKSIRPMSQEKALERWEMTLANTEETPQAIRPIAKSLINRDGPRVPTAVHCPLGITFHPCQCNCRLLGKAVQTT
jgi:hypothetical protein